MQNLVGMTHLGRFLSDHASELLKLQWDTDMRGVRRWRMSSDLLPDVVSRDPLATSFADYLDVTPCVCCS